MSLSIFEPGIDSNPMFIRQEILTVEIAFRYSKIHEKCSHSRDEPISQFSNLHTQPIYFLAFSPLLTLGSSQGSFPVSTLPPQRMTPILLTPSIFLTVSVMAAAIAAPLAASTITFILSARRRQPSAIWESVTVTTPSRRSQSRGKVS